MSMDATSMLAILAIGIGFGLCLALVAVMVYALYSAARDLRRDSATASREFLDGLKKTAVAMKTLRVEVTASLSRLDGERIHDSSVSLQRAVKSFMGEVDKLQKIVYAQPALDVSDHGLPIDSLESEAEDDARMATEAGRWNPDIVRERIPEVERADSVNQYFQRRNDADSIPSPFSGAYASLINMAQERGEQPKPPEDINGAADESELTQKGELD